MDKMLSECSYGEIQALKLQRSVGGMWSQAFRAHMSIFEAWVLAF